MSEIALQNRILKALSKFPDVIAFKRSVGHAIAPSGATVSFGVKGEADIQGIIGPRGMFFGIEVKLPLQLRRPEQITWADIMTAQGACVGVAYSVADAVSLMETWRKLYVK
jgi:hypothetical protein